MSWFERGRNPTPEALVQLLGRLDSNLSADFAAFLDGEDQTIRRELSLLVDRRNKIAHGLNEGVTPRRAVELTDRAREIADWLVLRLNPQ